MQPTKRSSSGSSLLLGGAPAKKAPESKDDSQKPSILKALEAVVAAGRRGLLGPAAQAAVEAMPDLDLEFCDGKVGRETPSPGPLVEVKKMVNNEFCDWKVGRETPSPGPLVEVKKMVNNEFCDWKVGRETPSPGPLVEVKKMVNNEFCDWKVGQETPSPGPLVEVKMVNNEFCDWKVGQETPSPSPLVEVKMVNNEFCYGKVGQETPSPGPLVEVKMVNNEFCDGKVAQETPSPVPLVEEKIVKKKKKKKKKKCNTLEAVSPPVESKPWVRRTHYVQCTLSDITSRQSTVKEIWICGNAVILSSSVRAKSSFHGSRLGLPPSAAAVYWRGIPTLVWDDLLPVLHQIYHHRSCPYILAVHLGERDLEIDSSCSLATRMQSDLEILRRVFPDIVIIWSSLLPKHFWKPNEKPQDMESERNTVNGKMEKYCSESGVCYLSHPLIRGENKCLFLPDNTLSNAGTDIFIIDLKKVLQTYFVP